MFISCEHENIINSEENFLVSQNELKSLLGNKETFSSKDSTSTTKRIEEIIPLNDDKTNEPLMYVVNYYDKGFVILAADKRVEPILAYSYNNKFDVSGEIDQGLAAWFETKINYIQNVKEHVKEPMPEIAHQWANLGRIPDHLENPDNNCDFVLEHNFSYEPLLKTKWGQGAGFNNEVQLAPTSGVFACESNSLPYNDRYYAGCVPIAIAQIARYHEFPVNYNWTSMSNFSGGNETSRFVKYIHDNIPITYKCTGTSVSTNVDIGAFFRNKLGYTNANSGNWSDNIVIANVSNNMPVYVSAGSTKKILFGTIKVRGTGQPGFVTVLSRLWDVIKMSMEIIMVQVLL